MFAFQFSNRNDAEFIDWAAYVRVRHHKPGSKPPRGLSQDELKLAADGMRCLGLDAKDEQLFTPVSLH